MSLPAQKQDETLDVATNEPVDQKSLKKKAPGAFLTISEVSDLLDVQQHVLRFWETKFSQVKPLKRGGGRRYYRPEDVALLQKIHQLLYTDKYTIKGVQKLLKGMSKMQIIQDQTANDTLPAQEPSNSNQGTRSVSAAPQQGGLTTDEQREVLREMLNDLRSLRSMIKS